MGPSPRLIPRAVPPTGYPAFTEAEHGTIAARAAQAGLSVHGYSRDLLLHKKMSMKQVSSPPFEVVNELRAIGVNINQMARKANAFGVLPQQQRLDASLSRIEALLDKVIPG